MNIYAVCSEMLATWDCKAGIFASWLHFDRAWSASDPISVANLIRSGCRFVLITGRDSEFIHDMVDYAAIDHSPDLVLTSAKEHINRDVAFEFLTTRCPDGDCAFRVLASFSDDKIAEVSNITDMMKNIEEVQIY